MVEAIMNPEQYNEAEHETEVESVPGESKADKFKRIGTRRLRAAVKAISLLENCAGYGYEYTPAQVEKMLLALTTAVKSVERAYKGDDPTEEITL